MLPGITPFFGGRKPPVVDAFTQSLIKCDGIIGTSAPTFLDYIDPARQFVCPGIGVIYQSGYFNTCFHTNGGSQVVGPTNDTVFDIKPGQDFTIDFWCATINGTNVSGAFLSKGGNATVACAQFVFFQNGRAGGSDAKFYCSSNGTTWDIANALQMHDATAGGWHHYAVTRQGTTWRLFVDGGVVQTWTSALNPMATVDPVRFCNWISAGTNYSLNSTIDEVRFSDTCRWTSAFTPQRYPYYGPLNGANDAATKFLLHADGANNATTTSDAAVGATVAHPITFNGTAKLSTTQAKFGGSSLQLDGSVNCRLTIPNTADFDPRSSDFTLDFWYYRTGTAAGSIFWNKRNTFAQVGALGIYDAGNGAVQWYGSSDNATWNLGSAVPIGTAALNAWTHFALCRANGNFQTYCNGIGNGVSANWFYYMAVVNNVTSIGGFADSASAIGFIDEFRWSDVGRWTGNFTPPSTPY